VDDAGRQGVAGDLDASFTFVCRTVPRASPTPPTLYSTPPVTTHPLVLLFFVCLVPLFLLPPLQLLLSMRFLLCPTCQVAVCQYQCFIGLYELGIHLCQVLFAWSKPNSALSCDRLLPPAFHCYLHQFLSLFSLPLPGPSPLPLCEIVHNS